MKPFNYLLILFISALVLFSCNDATTNPEDNNPLSPENEKSISVSGTINNPNNHDIPADAKMVVFWSVFTGVDYHWLWGEGDFNKTDMTFSINLDDVPKDTCYNDFEEAKLAVGTIALVDKSLEMGEMDTKVFLDKCYGVVEDRGIIYVTGDTSFIDQTRDWAKTFPKGYSLGKGDYSGTSIFDKWSFLDRKSDLIITMLTDNPKPKFPNWY